MLQAAVGIGTPDRHDENGSFEIFGPGVLQRGSVVGNQWRKANFRGSAIVPFEEKFLENCFSNLRIWWAR